MPKSHFDGSMSPKDIAQMKRMFEQKGRAAVLADKGAGHIFTEAEKLDVQRKGFLAALADLCAAAAGSGIPRGTIVECLKGAVEGMERV